MQRAGISRAEFVADFHTDVITPAASDVLYNTQTTNRQMPNSCGGCHNSIVGIAPNYAY